MMALLRLIFGGGSILSSITGEISKLLIAKQNATTEIAKAEIDGRIRELQIRADLERARLADVDSARKAAAGLPRWMAVIGFMIGFPFALHICFVGFGTMFAPWIIGGALDGFLHIPKWPAPLDQSELGIIIFFFGSATAISVGNSIAGAIAKRK